MARCDATRDLLGLSLDGELTAEERSLVERHLDECDDCRELHESLVLIADAIPPLDHLEPPHHLESDLSASPCRRWLGLLFQAVDREISQYNLERLLNHLKSCESCTRTWNDLTLIHQVSEAMVPPPNFVDRCIDVRRRIFQRPIISRRAVTAAAYLMAVLASLLIGNPVSIARSPVVQKVTDTVTTEVNQAAEHGRGELKVMLWRAWKWADHTIDTVQNLVRGDSNDDDSGSEQGAHHDR
jgi:predicted anti-sigma-YlaC factor YlaD